MLSQLAAEFGPTWIWILAGLLLMGTELALPGVFLAEEALRVMFRAGIAPLAAGCYMPTGQAVAAHGGYRITGRWAFASGIRHAEWVSGSAWVVNDGARFGVANAQTSTVNVNNLTLNTVTGGPTLVFDLNSNPATPLITVAGTLTTGAATNITVTNGATPFVNGSTIRLIQYGTLAGGGFASFTAGTLTLPNRVTGTLTDRRVGSSPPVATVGSPTEKLVYESPCPNGNSGSGPNVL